MASRRYHEQRAECRHEKNQANPTIPTAAPTHAAPTSRWTLDQRDQCRHGEILTSQTIPLTGHEQKSKSRHEKSQTSPTTSKAAPAVSTSRLSPDLKNKDRHGEKQANPTSPDAASTSRWIPEQRTESRHEKRSTPVKTWQEFYSDGIGEIKLRTVIDRGLVRTGRVARTGRKKITTEDEVERSMKKNKPEENTENSEVATLRRKFEVKVEMEQESTQIARTNPKNKGRIWKKTNTIIVKTESSKRRQELANNSPKTPRIKRLNNSKLNRTSAKPKLLPFKPEKTLSRFEKLLQDWEFSAN